MILVASLRIVLLKYAVQARQYLALQVQFTVQRAECAAVALAVTHWYPEWQGFRWWAW